MSDDRFERMAKQIGDIHAALFGVEGQGGLHRRVDAVEKDIAELKSFQAKVIGIASAASAALSLLGAKIFGLFK